MMFLEPCNLYFLSLKCKETCPIYNFTRFSLSILCGDILNLWHCDDDGEVQSHNLKGSGLDTFKNMNIP